MTRLRRRLRRLSRPIRIAIQIGILAVIVLAVGSVGFVEYSAQPSFCDNCHIMEPYYQSWATSSHSDVACIECHYAPGVKAEAMGKLQAANQVVKYITGTQGPKPWAEIEDAACLRGGCHTERKLETPVIFEGVRFNHAEHLGELRRGKQLRCTSCHSQIVQGDHVTVTQSTCYLCHFKDRPAGEPIAGCTGCHPSPPRVTSPGGFVVDHPKYVEELTSCISCHENVTVGSGAAERDRCFTCHNQPERLRRFNDVTLLHRVHIADHNVECTQCHLPIDHRVVTLTATFDLDCRGCHEGSHEAERRMYAGLGGHGAETTPSSMYLARVSCESCHGLPTAIEGHEQVQAAGEATCLSCHGVGYANILPGWQQGMERRLGQVSAIVREAGASVGRAPAARRVAADSLLGLARENVDLVRRGKGAHNVVFADKLLRAAVELTRDAVRRSGASYRVPEAETGGPVGGNECLSCHLGIEGRRVRYAEATFDHEPHVVEAELACSRCHTGLNDHGKTTLGGRAGCESCHHGGAQAASCTTCHEGARSAPVRPIAHSTGAFSHPVHLGAGVGCVECHVRPAMDTRAGLCESCHDRHHVPTASCLGCHRGGAMAIHPRSAHDGCAACHGEKVAGLTEWSREVCTVCHVDRTDHNAPMRCDDCHQVPPLNQGTEAAVPAGSYGLSRFTDRLLEVGR